MEQTSHQEGVEMDNIFGSSIQAAGLFVIGISIILLILYVLQGRQLESPLSDSQRLQAQKIPPKVHFKGTRIGKELKKKRKVLCVKKRIRRSQVESPPIHHTDCSPSPLRSPPAEPMTPALPPEVLYMMKSVRVLGHFERPLFLELCQHVVYEHYHPGSLVFCPGQPDSSIYIVLEGRLELSITDPDGTRHNMKSVGPGDNVHSLLSILDVLTGHQRPYRTVTAQAVEKSTLLRLPVEAFSAIFNSYPQSLVRTVQIIALRLQRVTFLALHHYLGLTIELFQHELQDEPLPASLGQSVNARRPPLSRSKTHDESTDTPATSKKTHKRAPPLGLCKSVSLGTKRSTSFSGLWHSLDCELEQSHTIVSLENREVPSSPSSLDFYSVESKVEDIQEKIESGKKQLAKLMDLEDVSLLDNRVSLHCVKADTVIAHQGEQGVGLHFVLSGCLHIYQGVSGRQDSCIFVTGSGEMIGQLTVLTGEPLIFTIRAFRDSSFLCLSRAHFYQIVRSHPTVLLSVAHSVARRVSPFVRQVDFAIDWIGVEAGKELYKMGDPSDCTYITLNGRLRSVIEHPDGRKSVVGEYGRGQLIGMVETLTHKPRAKSVYAVRDSELAKVPDGALSYIKRKYPQVVTRLIHILSQKIIGHLQHPEGDVTDSSSLASNLCTVCVLPCSNTVPLTAFTLELKHALDVIGPTLVLTSEIIRVQLGAYALERKVSTHECQLSSWLAQQEDLHRIVLYQTESTLTPWTIRCIRQADCILLVGLGVEEPHLGNLETFFEQSQIRALKQLVLLHRMDGPSPSGTVQWLKERPWLSGHFHIRSPKRMFMQKPPHRVYELYTRILQQQANRHSDFSRLARALTGNTIALVLGGGGARGYAHVGVLKALEEAGIPVDMVGGTSIGALVGGVYAEERNSSRTRERTSKWAQMMSSLLRTVMDLTYPIASFLTGCTFNDILHTLFGERQIQDLWLPYFSITTDISSSTMRVHKEGCLWRYVRASASYTPYLPPLCDPQDSHLLLDGCYVNNLPADVAHSLGARTVLAIDVGQQKEWNTWNYGDSLSGWWLLWNRLNPWSEKVKVPDMAELQSRLSYVSCVRQLEQVKLSGYCEYLSPPVQRFNTTDFNRFQEIHDVGYEYGKLIFTEWHRGDLIEKMLKDRSTPEFYQHQERSDEVVPGFTDLAEIVSRIEPAASQKSFTEQKIEENMHSGAKDLPWKASRECETDEEKTLRMSQWKSLAHQTVT
ncbi:neuropathy target esterase isoform X4 [Pelobates cultripes]|uniref:lysophospholipase n=1 Tax=Pelobates cultripes TaxID=61616 RepID=A0AAD1RMS8_PELCU|nr:neuropathy target esterase isoform X4 [Pelobates cultripes]